MKEFITLKEVQETIMVSNPGGRSLTVRTRDSGYDKLQVFTSTILPEKIPFKYIGLAKLEDESIHPAYMSEVIAKKLTLEGFTGFCNGPEILHSICRELLLQKGILIARSVLKSDFTLDYNHEDYESLKKSGLICIELENEKEDFWVAYNTYLPVLETYNMQYVDVKRGLINWKILATYIEDKGKFYRNYFIRTKAIRPVIILKSQVDVGDGENFKYKWIMP